MLFVHLSVHTLTEAIPSYLRGWRPPLIRFDPLSHKHEHPLSHSLPHMEIAVKKPSLELPKTGLGLTKHQFGIAGLLLRLHRRRKGKRRDFERCLITRTQFLSPVGKAVFWSRGKLNLAGGVQPHTPLPRQCRACLYTPCRYPLHSNQLHQGLITKAYQKLVNSLSSALLHLKAHQ